jgi:hypothetical protein
MEITTSRNQQWNPNSVLYCTLTYQSEVGGPQDTVSRGRLLVVLKAANDKLLIFVDPLWREIVDSIDIQYMEELLKDLPLRAKSQPRELFSQLCEMSTGPHRTEEVGELSSEHPYILELISSFAMLDVVP